jgi:hypothetical protein
MPLGGYSNASWFLRAVRVLSVIAFAASVGGLIGGFAIYALDSALRSEPRPDARAENQAAAPDSQRTKPVRIVGGGTPDPSVGMSAPPPAPQPRSALAPSQAQVSPQLLTPKPLGPAMPLRMQNEPKRVQTVPQPQKQTGQTPTPTGSAATPQATRWPDALSRAHEANQTTTNQTTTNRTTTNQTPPNQATVNGRQGSAPTKAQANPRAASTSADADRKQAQDREAEDQRAKDQQAKDQQAKDQQAKGAATADDQDRPSRRGRQATQRAITANAPHSTRDNAGATAVPGSRRQDARAYNRLYDSYGDSRNRTYSNARERSFGDDRDDQHNAASRSDNMQQRYRGRSRAIVREGPEKMDRDRRQVIEAARRRSEPFWGFGFFGADRGFRDDDD